MMLSESLPTGLPLTPALTLAEGFFLVSAWKPLLLLLPFIPWALIVSRILDKHAARFNLPREKYNTIHLVLGLAAVLIAIAMPMKGFVALLVGLAVMIAILAADVLIFTSVHNKDERVPAAHRINLLDFSKYAEAKKAKAEAKQAGKAELVIRSADKSTVAVPNADTPEFGLRMQAEALYMKAGVARASQVELLPGKDGQYLTKLLVDGVLTDGDAMPGADGLKVIDFWKGAAKLDLADRRKKLSGEVTVERGELKRKVRITSQGTQSGMRLQLLFDPEKAVQREVAEMGLLQQQTEELKGLIATKGGVVLVAAPPDGGRTTTFYGILRLNDAYTQNIQTVEIEPQASLEGIKQNRFDQTAEGPEYSTLVRSIMRRDPDVLGVAEMPDTNTAKEVSKADPERLRIYLSLGAANALQALQGYAKAVGDADAAAKNLRGVIAQRLVRKLCKNCKVPYQPSPDMLKKLGLPTDKVPQLYKKGGQVMVKDKPQACTMCDGGGYFGQEGAYEIFVFTDADRQFIKNQDWNGLKLELRKRNLATIQQSALRKAIDGTTSVEEVLRVTAEAPAPSSSSPPSSPPPSAPPAPGAGGAPKPGTSPQKPASKPAGKA
jgi:type II secretory ATPase GspE/PulE/Tfp pilus assembly ATPase PilB-like protein